jgi:hypothetical protein
MKGQRHTAIENEPDRIQGGEGSRVTGTFHKKINNFFILPYVQEVEMKGKQKTKRLGGWEAMKLGSEEGKKITG